MSKYGSELKEKEEILVLTKSDLVTEEKINQYKKKLADFCDKNVVSISINDLNSLNTLKKLLLSEKIKNDKVILKKWHP